MCQRFYQIFKFNSFNFSADFYITFVKSCTGTNRKTCPINEYRLCAIFYRKLTHVNTIGTQQLVLRENVFTNTKKHTLVVKQIYVLSLYRSEFKIKRITFRVVGLFFFFIYIYLKKLTIFV